MPFHLTAQKGNYFPGVQKEKSMSSVLQWCGLAWIYGTSKILSGTYKVCYVA